VNGYDVELTYSADEATFKISAAGNPVRLAPYLRAMGHLVVIRAEDLAFLHVHPMESDEEGVVRFMLHPWGRFGIQGVPAVHGRRGRPHGFVCPSSLTANDGAMPSSPGGRVRRAVGSNASPGSFENCSGEKNLARPGPTRARSLAPTPCRRPT
jgi:hypothetical protein